MRFAFLSTRFCCRIDFLFVDVGGVVSSDGGVNFSRDLIANNLDSRFDLYVHVGPFEAATRDEAGASQAAAPRVTQQSYLQQSIELSQAALHHLPTTTTNDHDSIDN
jgi:hypothetical protein